MRITLINHTTDPVNHIGHLAAICYDGGTDRHHNLRRAAHCVEHGHLATLRFAVATFLIEGISRACLAQLTRSKHLDYLVRSSRYCEENNAELHQPDSLGTMPDGLKLAWAMLEDQSRHLYQALRQAGMAKQDARFILPQSQCTELYVTGNFQAWRDFIRLRAGKEAQSEVRNVALAIRDQLNIIAPEIF